MLFTKISIRKRFYRTSDFGFNFTSIWSRPRIIVEIITEKIGVDISDSLWHRLGEKMGS